MVGATICQCCLHTIVLVSTRTQRGKVLAKGSSRGDFHNGNRLVGGGCSSNPHARYTAGCIIANIATVCGCMTDRPARSHSSPHGCASGARQQRHDGWMDGWMGVLQLLMIKQSNQEIKQLRCASTGKAAASACATRCTQTHHAAGLAHE